MVLLKVDMLWVMREVVVEVEGSLGEMYILFIVIDIEIIDIFLD